MANRRMFAKTIVESDAFTDLPLSSQALFFHLCMNADDEGFINNPRKIQRMIGASDDDLKLLLVKRFLIAFESGVVVVKHWRILNYIQKDRFTPTVYKEERKKLSIKENGSYTSCIQNVSKMYPQYSIGEVNKDSVGEREFTPPTLDEVRAFCDENRLAVSPEVFYHYYSTKCWKVNGEPLTQWHSKIKEWEYRDRADKQPQKNTSFDTDEFFEAAVARTYEGDKDD